MILGILAFTGTSILNLGELKSVDLFTMSRDEAYSRYDVLTPTHIIKDIDFSKSTSKDLDKDALGKFPFYIWVDGYNCSEL